MVFFELPETVRHIIMCISLVSFFFVQASPGIIANPFAAGIVRKNSMESISSIDRDLSPEEMDIMQKVEITHHLHSGAEHE